MLSSTAWTVECWVYFHSIVNYDFVFGQWTYNNQNFGFGYENNVMYFFGYNSSNTFRSNVNVAFNATTHIKKWHHLAAVYDGSNTKIYLNGKASANSLAENLGVQDRSSELTLGKTNRIGTNYYSHANITDARIVNGTAIYTSDFTPPTSPLTAVTNTVFLFQGDEANIIDRSQSIADVKLNGTSITASTTQNKNRASSIEMNLSGDTVDYVEISDYDGIQFSANQDFTIECWM